ncbi:MAG TPA: TOBE-like domain-containing protein [Mycobacteriales bacterium]|jgi:sulfate transport system ATP-binding protein|nr:TOBE-like domain-containing protein [Mycobacteriales bacterium]HVX70951.1 TOBE-like domain-containing protein [Mycobacteriales bacterium]
MSIQVRDVSKSFGNFHALVDVSVDIAPGHLTAVLGPSGGGKSTLLRIIAGLETADRGAVLIEGADVTHVPTRDRGIGFVFQHYAAFTHMTVWENVAFGLKIAKTPRPRIKKRVSELLELVHLDGLASRYPSELSGGQRQRMALARALAVEPSLLLLDEPFGALDVKVRQELREWLRRLHDEVHTTTVFVTHDQEEAMEIADQIIVINQGRVEQSGSPNELYDRPANDFVMGFLGPVTTLAGRPVRPHDIHLATAVSPGSIPATLDRVVSLGFETRVVAIPHADAEPVTVQLTRNQIDELALEVGDTVYLRGQDGDRQQDRVVTEMHQDRAS